MLITYLRSSSFNNWDYCQHQYFINYVLGWDTPSGLKAEKGTLVHKVMEVLANIKLALQANPNAHMIKDDNLGEIFFTGDDLLEPYLLSDQQVYDVNLSRKNKQIYVTPGLLKLGHIRYGVGLVSDIFKRTYDYYSAPERSVHGWMKADRRDCENWTWMVLDYKGGIYDPRRADIVEAEKRFDITIDRPWADFSYILPDGKEIEGKLSLKGTLDLTRRPETGILEIVDYKTGQRLDWCRGGEKTYAKLQQDPQLLLYYWAVRNIFPEVKNVILTIFYVRDGGPFSLCFEDSDLELTERLIEKRFREIRNSQNPVLLDPTQRNFKCERLCAFYKNKLQAGDGQNMCHRIHDEINKHGLEYVTMKYTKPGHSIGKYNAPGE